MQCLRHNDLPDIPTLILNPDPPTQIQSLQLRMQSILEHLARGLRLLPQPAKRRALMVRQALQVEHLLALCPQGM